MMSVTQYDANFYENVNEEFIEELVNKELESLHIDLDDLENENSESKDDNKEYEPSKKAVESDDDDDDKIDKESEEILESKWLPYKKRREEFYNVVEDNIIESERLLKEIPNTARDVLREIKENVATQLDDDMKQVMNDMDKYEDESVSASLNNPFNDVEGSSGDDALAEIASEAIELEKEFQRKMKEFDEVERLKDEERKHEETERRKKAEMDNKEADFKWQQIQEKLQKEKDLIESQKRKIEEQHNKMMIEQQRCIDRNLEILKINLELFTNEFESEKQNLMKYEEEKQTNESKRQNNAATQIQRYYRGYRVRKRHGDDVKAHVKQALSKREQQKVFELELEMEYQEEKRKIEEEKKRKLENERKRLKEQQEYELEMEKLRLREIEEEKQRQEEERRHQEEIEKRKRETEETNRKQENVMSLLLNSYESIRSGASTPRTTGRVENSQIQEELESFVTEETNSTVADVANEKSFVRSKTETIINGYLSKMKDIPSEMTSNEMLPIFTAQADVQLANTNINIDESQLKLNLNETSQNEIASNEMKQSKIELGSTQTILFNDWQKHNRNNFFDTIRQEYQMKLQQTQQIEDDEAKLNNSDNQLSIKNRPRSGKLKQITNIPENLLLKKSDKRKLSDISCLCFHALTTYSLQTLELCTNLSYLVINNSQITALDGLQNCSNLKYLNAQSNKIDWIDLKNLPQLIYLNLSNNSLTSIQNLSNCNNLRYLNIAYNRLTRLGFLNTNFANLQYLNVSNNQLINTIGLSNCIHLQFIDLSSNNLNSIEDLDQLALLLELNGSKNNLLQVPDLINQILLTSLKLNDNSVSTLNEMSSYWMPLLKRLELTQNRIYEMPPLNGVINLEDIIIENNNICDLESIIELKCLKHLKQIELTNNPIINEENIDFEGFQFVDDSSDNKTKLVRVKLAETIIEQEQKFRNAILKISGFIETHKTKITSLIDQFQNSNVKSASSSIRNEETIISNVNQLASEFDILHNYVIKLRYIFELNDLNFISKLEEEKDVKKQLDSYENIPKIPSRPTSSRHAERTGIFSARLERIKKSNTVLIDSNDGSIEHAKQTNGKISDIELYMQNLNKNYTNEQLNKYAAVIQSRWKGYRTRKDIDTQVCIMAATIIQSRWRGYAVRKRMKMARERLNQENEFDLEEIDLNQFEFDEAKFDIKVPVPPPKPILHISNNNHMLDKPPRPPSSHQLPPVVDAPRKAWKGADSSRASSVVSSNHENYANYIANYEIHNNHVPPLNSYRSLNPESESHLLGKHENIVNDWGFKDHRTAMLMLQRADRMKYRVERKNKMKSLDPKQRLKFLRKFDKFTPRITSRTQQNVHQNNPNIPATANHTASHSNHFSRTYEWVHSQVRDVPVTPAPEQVRTPNTKLPKLPQLTITNGINSTTNGNNMWRKSSSGNSSLENANPLGNGKVVKSNKASLNTSKQSISSPFQDYVLPPLKIKSNTNQHDLDQLSVASSFTQMFLNTKTNNNNSGNTKKPADIKRKKK